MSNQFEEISKMTMYEHVFDFPEQIESALDISIGEMPASDKICVCGMGSSAMAGDILSDFVDSHSDIPVHVVRGIDLPKWVDRDTLVITISYSGDTQETLSLYESAKSRECRVICITSGGELLRRCTENGDRVINIPAGRVSRTSLGYLLGILASLLESMMICNSRTELMNIVPSLKEFRDSTIGGEDEIILPIVRSLDDNIPVIYSHPNMRSSAIRWKTQINENSKMIAFCGTIPEFNHNEIIGWTEDSSTQNFAPVVLYDERASEMMKVMTDTTISMLSEKGLEVNVFRADGRNDMEKNLKCIILGDLISLYLAHMRGVDPYSMDSLHRIREHMSVPSGKDE